MKRAAPSEPPKCEHTPSDQFEDVEGRFLFLSRAFGSLRTFDPFHFGEVYSHLFTRIQGNATTIARGSVRFFFFFVSSMDGRTTARILNLLNRSIYHVRDAYDEIDTVLRRNQTNHGPFPGGSSDVTTNSFSFLHYLFDRSFEIR